jgi:hypothetical protein
MTISGWVLFSILSLVAVVAGVAVIYMCETGAGKALSAIITIAVILGILFGMLWYFGNTASGQRAFVDQKSELNNGIERTVTVYTADGNIIAQFAGNIDIADSDGGYVKFDFEGKRYIYYNCFVETIADID